MAPRPEQTAALIAQVEYRHPVHGHAFARTSNVVGARCAGCAKLLWGPFSAPCRCLYCGVAAHRACLGRLRHVARCAVAAAAAPAPATGGFAARRASAAAISHVAVRAPLRRWWRGGAAPEDPPSRSSSSSSLVVFEDATVCDAAAVRAAAAKLRAADARRGNLRLWAGSAACGVAGGAVVGGAVAGPAGAVLGAKVAQAVAGTVLIAGSPAATGALVGGAAVGYRRRSLLSGDGGDRERRRAAALESGRRAVERRGGSEAARGEPWRARGAAARAACEAARLPWCVAESDGATSLATALADSRRSLDEEARLFAAAALKPEHAPGAVRAELASLFRERRALSPGDVDMCLDDAAAMAGEAAVDVLAFHGRAPLDGDVAGATLRAADAAVLGDVYDHVFTALVVRHEARDDAVAAALACRRAAAPAAAAAGDDPAAARAADALRGVVEGRSAHAKLRAVVFALEALAEARAGEADVSADALLPRAAACVAAADVPHLHAELAFMENFATDESFLGVEGYALTTLRCALSIVLGEAGGEPADDDPADDDPADAPAGDGADAPAGDAAARAVVDDVVAAVVADVVAAAPADLPPPPPRDMGDAPRADDPPPAPF